MNQMNLLIHVNYQNNLANQNTNFDYYCKLVENMNNIDPVLIFENYLNLKEKILKYYQKITELTESQKD